jgi:hypothetical protein
MTETRKAKMDPLATMTPQEYATVMRNLDRRGLTRVGGDWAAEDRSNTEAERILRVLRAR